MFKMFAVLCVLVWPDDVMTSELQCTTWYEQDGRTFATRKICEEAAEKKLVITLNEFEELKIDFQSILTGCEPT